MVKKDLKKINNINVLKRVDYEKKYYGIEKATHKYQKENARV